MSTQFTGPGRTVSAGDLVIPISEIFDRLQSTVDANTLEQLLRDIISGRRNQVRPGELITAELMNQILAQLESLEARVTRLEAGTGTTPTQGQVVITSLDPPNDIRIEEELKIFGREFSFSRGAARVQLNGAERTIKAGSSDTELRIDIPSGTPLGRATIRVLNSLTSAERNINILPAQTPLLGNPTVRFLRVDPTQILITGPGRLQTFFYELDATGMSRSTTFMIDPFFSFGTWDAAARIVTEAGASRSSEFRLAPGQRETFGVAVNSPAVTGGTSTVTSRIDVRAESRTWQLADLSLRHGETLLPSNPAIRLGTVQVAQAAGTFDDETNTITGEARLSMPLTLTAADTFTPIADPVDGSALSSSNWTRDPPALPATTITEEMLRAGSGSFLTQLTLTFTPAAGARTVEIEVGYRNATSKTVERFTLTT